MSEKFDIIIIGAGPGGYVAAIKAGQAGKKVACIDKAHLGGICLNWGCIPTKAFLKSAEVFNSMKHAKDYGLSVSNPKADLGAIIDRSRKVSSTMTGGIEFLFKKNGVTHIAGTAKVIASNLIEVTDGKGEVSLIETEKVIVSTGASPVNLPFAQVDGTNIISYRQALELKDQPKKMLVIGAGAIGVEFSYFFNSIGTEIHLVEMADQLLPVEDEDSSKVLAREFKKQGINVYTGSKTKSVEVVKKGKIKVVVENAKGKEVTIEVDRVLSAVGMKANTSGLGLDQAGVKLDERGNILVNEYQQTSNPSIYAIGDCAGKQMLAHKASFEGEVAVAHICGEDVHGVDYGQIPGCTYCQPQVAGVGLTEKAAKAAGHEIKVGKFPFTASGKAHGVGHPEGMVKLIFDASTEAIIGAHIVGYDATEMIAELGLAMKLEATWEEIAHTVHAHPTLSEATMEAALD
ncbi:MAG: dihydrolipoyl dehydrogenase, partial [Lentisphaeraceae bacterium]|nr:dihydrolipoyl dehydrogenase [Lentisphaeraceae bacterium]